MPAVEVDELVVRYGTLVAVDRLSFTASAGTVTALLGPNGAGKSSTIETLEGYRSPDAGSVRVLGLDPIRDHRDLVGRIGVMLQSDGLYPGIRVGEAIALFRSYYGGHRSHDELVALCGLGERQRATVKQLSGGEQQRLSLALALAGEPEVAFLDEPTAGVDVAGRQQVRRVIRELAQQGCAVLLTSHELDEVERLADHVVIIDRGRVVATGSPDELRRSASTHVRFASVPGLDTSSLSARLGADVTEAEPGDFTVQAAGSPALVADLTAWLAEHDHPLGDLRVGRQRLEDVFLELTAAPDTPRPESTRRAHRRRRP